MTEKFSKLTDFQHSRIRSELYLGSRELHTQAVFYFDGEKSQLKEFTWVPALFTGFREILDNSLDEIIGHGHGDTIRVEYDPQEMIFTVEDNGRGIPIEEKPELGKGPAASILLGEARTGRNFDQRGTVAGMNGLGAAIVNFTSEWFQLDIWRSNKHFRQKWDESTYGGKEIHRTSGPNIMKGAKDKTGTRIQYKPSAKVYKSMVLPEEMVLGHLWVIAVANPGIKVYWHGKRLSCASGRDTVASTLFQAHPHGLIDIAVGSFRSRFYVVPRFHEGKEIISSTVNNIPAFQGGTHIDAFKGLFYPAMVEELGKQLKKEKITVSRPDIEEGLLVFNVTQMENPNFDAQSKSRLITETVQVIREGFLESDVKSLLRRNPEWAKEILERTRARAETKEMKEFRSTQKKMKKDRVIGLKDATGDNRRDCILFLAEGESAIVGMTSARDANIHGGMGLRGKILNVWNEKPSEVVKNKAIQDIMMAVGLEIGVRADPKRLRYGKLFLATDEDEDGKHIICLIVAFLYKFWPELFQDKSNPFVYKFCTPFVICQKGKAQEYFYSFNYEEFNTRLAKGDFQGHKIIRAKGLGRLTKTDWEYAVQNPKVIPFLDDGKMKEILTLIFDRENADKRKEWLANDSDQ